MSVRRCLVLALLTACGGDPSDDDAPDTELTDTDTVDLPEDTFQVDTEEPAADSDDTGRFYSLMYEGHGRVARNVSFEATQALTAVWLKGGVTPGAPRCMYVQSLVDWGNDPARTTASPITSEVLAQCPGCEFTFTVSFQEPDYADGYPAVYAGFEEDTDFVPERPWSDTDAAPDLAAPSATARRKLTCETLTGKLDYPAPDEILETIGDWRGIGFDVEGDHDDDPQTGVIYTVGADNLWAESYDGWWNAATGELYWTGLARPAEYPLY